MVQATTANRNYALPDPLAFLSAEVTKLINTFIAIDADVGDIYAQLAQKASATHTHAISDITSLQQTLDAKASTAHNHTLASLSDVDITGAPAGRPLVTLVNGNIGFGAEYLSLDAQGRLLVGTTLTAGKLTVAGTGSSGYVAELRADAGVSNPAILAFLATNDAASMSQQAHIAVYQPAGGGAADAAMDFRLRGSVGGGFGNPGTIMTLLGSGYVGIGTTSPQVQLDVEANLVDFAARIVNSGNSFTRRGLSLQGGNVNDFNFLQAKSFDGSRIVDFWIDEGALRLDFGGSEKLRIDPAGYVGINTGAPLRPLHVNNGTAGPITGLSGSTAAIFQNDASNCFIQLISSGSNVSDVIFGTAASAQLGRLRYSANADYLSLWTGGVEKMRLDTDGNLLLGTTAPAPAYGAALEVNNAGNGGLGGLLISNFLPTLVLHDASTSGTAGAYRVAVNDARFFVQFDPLEDGNFSETRLRIEQDGALTAEGIYNSTTASAANVFVDVAGTLMRSTSSAKYKTEIADMTAPERGVLMDLRPVSYLSTCQGDDPKRRHFGLIAEEVFEVSPTLVHLGEDGSPEGVMYERIVPHLIAGHQNHEARIAALEAAS